MTNKTLHKVLVKLAAVLAILFLVLPTGLTAVTVLAEQANTTHLTPVEITAGEIAKESDLDFEQAVSESGEVLKDDSASWIQVTYNKVNHNLNRQDLFLRLPKGMTIEGIGQDQKLDVKTISVPKDLDLDEAASTINNTNIITGFEKIGEQDYKLSFAATSGTLNLVFKVTDTILNETRDIQLGDKQDPKQASFTKKLSLDIVKSDDRAGENETTTRPSIQPRAVTAPTDAPTTGDWDVSQQVNVTSPTFTFHDNNKNGIYDVAEGDSFSFKAAISLLDSRYIVPGNYFELKLSDTIHYNMLNPTDVNFPVLKQDGKVIATPELVQDPPVDGLIRATGKSVRYRFTDQVTGMSSLNMSLDLGHSVNPNVVQNNGTYSFTYQIGKSEYTKDYQVVYAEPSPKGNINLHQRLTYTDSKYTNTAQSLIYVNPKQAAQDAGKQTLTILTSPTTHEISGQIVPNLLQLNAQTTIKVYKLKDPKGITDAVNLDKQYWEEIPNPTITKSDGKIEVSFNYTQNDKSAYAVEVGTTLQHEGTQPVFIAQKSNLTIANTGSHISETSAIATVGSGGSAAGATVPKGSLFLNKINNLNEKLANATFTLSGNTSAGEFLFRTLLTDTKQVAFTNIPPGNYQLRETLAPSGYVRIETPWTVTVDDKGKVTVTGNEADTQKAPEETEVVILWESTKWNYGDVRFYKDRFKELVDSLGNKNAKYTLIRYSGDTSDSAQIITQSASSAEFNKILDSGTLTTSTMTNRKGMLKAYQLALQQFQASKNKQKYLLQLTNYPIYPGYREEKDFMSQSQTSFDAMKSLGVVPYLLVERDPYANRNTYLDPKAEAPSFGAFYPADNIKVAWSNNSSTLFTPPMNTNYTTQIQSIGSTIKQQIPESILTVTDKKSGKFSINKIDEAKKGLAGATFTLSKRTTVAADHQVQGDFTPVSKETTAERTTLTFNNLKPGVYDLKETKAPVAYTLDSKTYVVVVQNSGKTTIVDEADFKESNYPMDDTSTQFDYPIKEITNQPNSIAFTKIGDGGKSLTGAEFELRKGNEKVQTATSSTDGKVTFTKLFPGTYEVWETKVSDNIYQLPTEAIATFEVKADGTFSEPTGRLFRKNSEKNNRYEIRNVLINKKMGNQKIKVIKKDELTEVPLPNAKFQLEASDGTIYTKTTDVKGEIVFEKLPYGQYILTEIEAPTGYVLDKTPQKINITEVSALETEVVAGRNATQPTVAPTARAALAAPVAEPVTGKNVSDQISIKELDITSSNEDTPRLVRPNHGENIVMRAGFTINPGSDIKAGDFFTLTLPNTIDPFGVSAPENVDFRILGPLGTLALGTYDSSTHTITYKFTDYITRYTVSSFSTISPFFIDRDRVKTNQDIDLFLKVGQVSSTPYHFTVDYNPYWTASGRYIPYGTYTESFTYNAGVVKKSGESNADGSVVVRLSNRKNYIDFTKSDSQGTPLEATFELRKKTANDTVTVRNAVSDKGTGKFYFEGLPPGEYEVWETKAPDGYVKPVKAVATFRINDEGEVVEKSLEDGRIINYPRPELPATGGMGWIVYMVMGSAICFIAIFWNRPFRFKK
ncbi:SpaA isopeptide-forming pilin-related protein [Streptococcus dysgalactiae]|uniref:SpaA isopeptide-forming pilin-related protein n=1 Tax=Streptococcus dysgalactiae TaxID=1334 RepID=UPI003531690A